MTHFATDKRMKTDSCTLMGLPRWDVPAEGDEEGSEGEVKWMKV
jgi:hypothetical protein